MNLPGRGLTKVEKHWNRKPASAGIFRESCLLRDTFVNARTLVLHVHVSATFLCKITVNLTVRCWRGFLPHKIRTVSCENPSSGLQVVIRHTCSIRALHTCFLCVRQDAVKNWISGDWECLEHGAQKRAFVKTVMNRLVSAEREIP